MDGVKQIINYYNKKETERRPHPTGILKVNLRALESNIKKIHAFASVSVGKKLKFLLPIKGNGYGSGLIPIAKFVEKKQLCDYLGVAHFKEAYELKRAGIQMPILVLAQSFLKPDQIGYIVKYNIEQAISHKNLLRELNREAKKQNRIADIHLKVDTGMGRLGVFAKDTLSFIKEINKCKNIRLTGVITHFSVADINSSKQFAYTEQQIKIFTKLKEQIIVSAQNNNIIFHAANSAGTLKHPSSLFNMIRPGIASYGYPERYGNGLFLKLRPIMQVITRIAIIKIYPKGRSIGYGRTYISKRGERIAIAPIGYADGLNRGLSNRLTPIVNNKRARSIGRISMDQFCVKVGKRAKAGDEVVIIGQSGRISNSAHDIADQINTISYEILCNFGSAKRMRHEYCYIK
ncbi:alanine racemase [Candidatus Parcubacteria bacterium]|nr:alanine racemase [Candidatus Parcubacteria bacterium]